MPTPPDFSAGSVLTAAQMNKAGMWLVKSETGVSATFAVPYGVESVFTSDYRNYRLVWYASQASANADMMMQFYTGTNTAVTTGVYGFGWGGSYIAGGPVYNFGAYSTTNPFAPNTSLYLGATIASTYSGHGWLDIYAPQVSNVSTRHAGQAFSAYGGVYYNTALNGVGGTETTAQYTGFRLFPTAGTATFTYRLYGYRD